MTVHVMMYSSLEPMHSDLAVLPDQLFLLPCIHDLLTTVYQSLFQSLGVTYTVINVLIVRLVLLLLYVITVMGDYYHNQNVLHVVVQCW